MASLRSLTYVLDKIRDKLLLHPAFQGEGGPMVDDPTYAKSFQELESLSSQLSVVLRELKSKSSLLEVRSNSKSLRRLPFGDRYLQVASMRSEQAEIADVTRAAMELRSLLDRMIINNSTLSSGDLAHGLQETVERLFGHSSEADAIRQLFQHTEYVPIPKQEIHGGFESLAVPIFVLLRILLLLKKKRTANAS